MSVLHANLAKIKNYCAYQERCQSEVRTKLIELGEYGDDLEEAISILITENYLNEERFAILYAGSKFRQLQWGKVKITLALKAKQISQYCISKGTAEITDEDYFATLQKLYKMKKATLKSEKNIFIKKTKLKNYLLQKGYESNLVLEIINEK